MLFLQNEEEDFYSKFLKFWILLEAARKYFLPHWYRDCQFWDPGTDFEFHDAQNK